MEHKKRNAWLWTAAAVLAACNAVMRQSPVWLAIAVLFGLSAWKWYRK